MRSIARVSFFLCGTFMAGLLAGCFRDRMVTEPDYAVLDTRRPAVSYVVPTGNALNVPTNPTIEVWFDGLMNETSVAANFGLYPILQADSISAIAINPTNPDVLYAGKTGSGILKSVNGGKSWNWMTRSLPRLSVTDLAINPIDPQVVYAGTTTGVYKSSDGGSNWSPRNTNIADPFVTAIRVDQQKPERVFVMSQTGGVFRSDDGGGTWTPFNNGLGSVVPILGVAFTDIAINPNDGAVLYVATRNNRIFKSTNAGDSWALLGPAPRSVRRLSVSRINPYTLYAGTFGTGVYRSINGGTSWTAMNTGLLDMDVYSIAVHPKDSSTILAGTPTGVYKTIDGGASWQSGTTAPAGIVRSIAFHPSTPSGIFAGTTSNIYSSTNTGSTFEVAGGVSRQYEAGTFSFQTWQDSTRVISRRDSVTVDTVKIRPYVLDRALSLWIAYGRQGAPPVDPNPQATKAIFTPSGVLLSQWKYEIRINGTFESDAITLKSTRGAEDPQGNSLEKDRVSNFTTRR